MKHFLILSAMLFSFAASAQTEQEYVYENMPKPENNTYRYVVVTGVSTTKTGEWDKRFAEANKDAVRNLIKLQASRLSLPTDSISALYLNYVNNISNHKVYIARVFHDALKDNRVCVHCLCLLPESETVNVNFDLCNKPDYEEWVTTNMELIKKFREEHDNK